MSAADDGTFAAALCALPGCGVARLRSLLAVAPAPSVWSAVADGSLIRLAGAAEALGPTAPSLARTWREAAASVDLSAIKAALDDAGARVVLVGGEGYPDRLVADPDPPAVLFTRGDGAALSAPATVAIVGTRQCTRYGIDVARDLGRELAAAGVAVISGLALGIDGAAHEGALAGARASVAGAKPIGVVGSGLDVVYPPRHRPLWRRMGEEGVLVSEAPLGSAPEAWRFPLRNRIIAGLADVVVVVESHAAGGSMSTVRAADERGVPVMAVPGSIRSRSSAGTNRLLADGVAPVVDAADVLVALSLRGRHPAIPAAGAGAGAGGTAAVGEVAPDPSVEVEGLAPLDAAAERVLAAVDWAPTGTEDVLRRTALGIAEVSAALVRLEVGGRIVRHRGGWWERTTAG